MACDRPGLERTCGTLRCFSVLACEGTTTLQAFYDRISAPTVIYCQELAKWLIVSEPMSVLVRGKLVFVLRQRILSGTPDGWPSLTCPNAFSSFNVGGKGF